MMTREGRWGDDGLWKITMTTKKIKEGSVDKWLLSSSTWILTGVMWWGAEALKGFKACGGGGS